MKKSGRKWAAAACFLLAALFAFALECTPVHAAKLPRLKVKGTHLVNSKGKTVQLKGVSTHGLSWYPESIFPYEEEMEGKCRAPGALYQ